MRILLTLCIIAAPMLAAAFVAVETDISQPYEIVPIEVTLPEQVSFLGTLEEYPVMYEITADSGFTFEAQLSQPARQDEQPFSLLLIRKNDRGGGVTEIARQTINPTEWNTEKDSLLGLSFLTAPVMQEQVESGTYRLEVSSPDNQGQYLLTIGSEPAEVGYFDQLGYIKQTQSYFGYGFFSMLKSSYVYYPIGILLLLLAFYKTWQLARMRKGNA